MFVRVAIAVAALFALSAGGASACQCRAAVHHPAPHAARRPALACHCARARPRLARFVRHARSDAELGVGYIGPEPAADRRVYDRQETVSESWSSRRFQDGAVLGGWGQAHLSDTDQDGYLTWPGKHRYEAYAEQVSPCPRACAAPQSPYAQDAYPEDPRAEDRRAREERRGLDLEGASIVHGYVGQAADPGAYADAPQGPDPYDDDGSSARPLPPLRGADPRADPYAQDGQPARADPGSLYAPPTDDQGPNGGP